MSDRPEVAVVVAAYNRREYLLDAVRSLEAQTLPRDRFEVVVTKNFREPEIDRSLERSGTTVLFDEEPIIGRFLRRAVNASSAPWVAFLDDDDEFEPERLERLVDVVRSHPDVGFYRNRVSVIDQHGRPIPEGRWRVHEIDRAFDELGPVHLPPDGKRPLFELATGRTYPMFNNSSMAVRRDLLDGELGDAFERNGRTEDTFLFLLAAVAPVGIFLDDRRLTRYRYYAGNVSGSVRWFRQAAESATAMAGLARAHDQLQFADWFRDLAIHLHRMERGGTIVERLFAGAERREVGRLALEYFRYLGQHPAERKLTLDTWAAGFYGLGYVVVPSAIRGLARARITAERT
jgi:glycosyltransferase involved in cell wall biosynthesis